jgi:predicted Zn-dependent protease
LGAIFAARAGYSPAGLIDVLHKLNARTSEPTMKLLYATHPHPTERLTELGNSLEKQMASLPAGEEPPLQVAADSLPAPVMTAGQPVSGNRALSSEQQQPAQQQQPAAGSGLPSNLFGGQGGGGIGDAFRGILRR